MANRVVNIAAAQTMRNVTDIALYYAWHRYMKRDHILIACMPKSGSTFLSNVISRLPEFRKISLIGSFQERTEKEIYFPKALRKYRYNYSCQQHVKYNENTAAAISAFDITPVVLVRNIFDCVVSIRDHLRREAVESPIAYFLPEHPDLPDDELESAIVRLAIPWYIHFYVSWKHCPDAIWVTYEEATQQTADVIEKIFSNSHRNFNRAMIEKAIGRSDPSKDRRNVGQSGRGEDLSEENKEAIRRYRSFYPGIDFSLIGLY